MSSLEKYTRPGLFSIPVYDFTSNSRLSEILRRIIVEENIHNLSDIFNRTIELGAVLSKDILLSRLKLEGLYISIGDDFWEDRTTLVNEISEFVLARTKEFSVKTRRSMPEMECVIHPGSFANRIPRYSGFVFNEDDFSLAVVNSAADLPGCELIITNGVIVNFREAFVKDVYNILLRERGPLGSLDIALRLFDSKVGIYKKSLKASIAAKRNSECRKIIHHPLHPNEMWKLSRQIEDTIDRVIQQRKDVFVRLSDGRVNTHRNHVGVIRVKLAEGNYLTINLSNECDVARNVQTVIDANKPFLTNLLNTFRAYVDEEEIRSRFYEKLWQSIIQYDDVWGHKFHTFLHRALKNILLDERTKREKIPPSVSLNSTVNDKNDEELINLLSDTSRGKHFDPAAQIQEMRFIEMLRKDFSTEEQDVIFLIIDGFKDREIAQNLNKKIEEIIAIKHSLSLSPTLTSWFYQDTGYKRQAV